MPRPSLHLTLASAVEFSLASRAHNRRCLGTHSARRSDLFSWRRFWGGRRLVAVRISVIVVYVGMQLWRLHRLGPYSLVVVCNTVCRRQRLHAVLRRRVIRCPWVRRCVCCDRPHRQLGCTGRLRLRCKALLLLLSMPHALVTMFRPVRHLALPRAVPAMAAVGAQVTCKLRADLARFGILHRRFRSGLMIIRRVCSAEVPSFKLFSRV
mmetsp:Transcript_3259/g.7986  ORF Transcript_3259/g.7986 Transcript_3259/m.7986 type:complete len:209 (+) Transcript_3259:462-1088(+)